MVEEDGSTCNEGLLHLFQTANKSPKHEVKVHPTIVDMLPLVEVQDDVPGGFSSNFSSMRAERGVTEEFMTVRLEI